ncbi:hypothetical protein VZT92_005694 [Zoarces viviparus]|uniref:Fibronectin type-III domain-containing protein n=1 Tax=Zoarces viviparus TaxID=48416 RepID=A0AAW1FTE9_ZOAVI
MDGWPLVLYLTLLLGPVLSFIPAPVNVSVSSVNFRHVLHWDPGPGTPAGAQYQMTRRVNGRSKKHPSNLTTMTSLKLKLSPNREYVLTVQASYNQTLSEESNRVTFTPFKDTTIGPPKVSLAGCGNCIHLNISLPEADPGLGSRDMKTFSSSFQFQVFWRKHKEPEQSAITTNKSYTVNNLQIDTEYCVRVYIRINTNANTVPSAWNCTFTSVEPSRDPVFLGAVAALLAVIGALMSAMLCLYYTGFLCKLKAALPRVLAEVLSLGHTLTPEKTVPDNISIGTEKQRKHNNPLAPRAATRGTDSDEEEEGENVYLDRDAELSSGESSCQDSVDVLGNSKVAVSGGSGSSTVKAEVQDTEVEVEIRHGGLAQNEAKAEGTEVSFMPEGPVTGQVKEEEEEEEEEEVCESLGNIDLFSVTLAALKRDEGEEQNTRESLTDCVSDLEPLLPTNSERTLSHTDDRTTLALTLPTEEDFGEGGYEARRMNPSSGCLSTRDGETQHEETQEEEEEEEEEEFSGYMGRT